MADKTITTLQRMQSAAHWIGLAQAHLKGAQPDIEQILKYLDEALDYLTGRS